MAILRATVRLAFAVGSGGGTNTWHIRVDDDVVSPPTVRGDTMAGIQAFYEAVSGIFPEDYSASFDGQLIQLDGDDLGDYKSGGDPWSVNGEGTGTYLPNEAMVVVGWRTSSSLRSARCRTFLGPLDKGMLQTDGTVFATGLGIVQDAANGVVTFNTGVDSLSAAIGCWSETTSIFRDYTGAGVRDRFAVLRSRRD